MKRTLGYVLRIGLGIGLLALAFIVLDIAPADLLSDLGEIDLVQLTLLIVPVLLLDRLLMTYKWGLLLRAAGIHIPLWELFNIYLISGFVGSFLPVSVGADMARFYQMHRKKLDSAEVAASIVIERLLGFVAVLAWAVVTVPLLAWMYPESRSLLIGVGSLLIVLPLLPLVLVVNRPLLRLVRTVTPRLIGERLSALSARLYRAFHAYKSRGRVLFVFFLLSVLETGLTAVANIICAWALDIDISMIAIAFVVPLALVVVRLPISFSGIGVFEWSYVSLYALVGMGAADALSFGLLVDVVTLLFNLCSGLVLVYYLIRWRRSPAPAGTGTAAAGERPEGAAAPAPDLAREHRP